MSALSITGFRLSRGGKVVLRDVDMELQPGQITALLGANGAGKSSLVLGLAGVLKPTAGRVVLDGQNHAGQAPDRIRAAGIVAVPEGHRVLTDLTVRENLEVAGSVLARARVAEGVARALEVFPELGMRLDQRAGTLSGGQQQMLALGQALVSGPRFLLADELSFGLAPVVVSRLMEVLEHIAQSGTGVLLIEQFTTIALRLATTAYLIERGQIRWSGPSAVLSEKPELLHAAYLAGDFGVTSQS
jgi:branched-chain amino acid transport system ATP-binding protein